MARLTFAVLVLCSAALAGCGANSDHPLDGGHSGDAGGTFANQGADAGNNPNQAADAGADAGTDAGTTAPGAPTLTSVQLVVHGTMKLDWQNPSGGCDSIVISRKSTGSYAVVQTVSGSLTSANDSPGHASGTFCYTLACTRGGLSSLASNERCASQ